METLLRSALIAWLRGDAMLATGLNAVAEEAPPRTARPWLGVVASASIDWSTKDRAGREIRIALELQTRGEEAEETAAFTAAIEARVASLPRVQDGFVIASTQFLRARAEQRPRHTRAVLLEYRFRVLAA